MGKGVDEVSSSQSQGDDKQSESSASVNDVEQGKKSEPKTLSAQAKNLISHGVNGIGHYVEMLLNRRYIIATALTQSKQALDLTGFEQASRMAGSVQKIGITGLSTAAQLAGTFIQMLKEKESQHQLWLACFYRALNLNHKEFSLLSALVGSHVDTLSAEVRDISADVSRSIALKWVLKFEAMFMDYAPCLTQVVLSDVLATPGWYAPEFQLDKRSIQRIDAVYQLVLFSFNEKNRLSDGLIARVKQGIFWLADSTERDAAEIENVSVYLKPPTHNSALSLYLCKQSIPIVPVKGVIQNLPEEFFDLKDFPFGRLKRLTQGMSPPLNAVLLGADQTKRVVAFWLSQRVFDVISPTHFYSQKNQKLLTAKQVMTHKKEFMRFFTRLLFEHEEQLAKKANLLEQLMTKNAVSQVLAERIENAALVFRASAKITPDAYASNRKQLSRSYSLGLSFVEEQFKSAVNDEVRAVWNDLMWRAAKQDRESAQRVDYLQADTSTLYKRLAATTRDSSRSKRKAKVTSSYSSSVRSKTNASPSRFYKSKPKQLSSRSNKPKKQLHSKSWS